jgi:gas vesicle protein
MSQDSGSSLVVFVMGIAVGAVAAALYTPVAGPALRRRLSRAADAGAGMANDALEHADEFVRDKTKAAKKFASKAGDAFQKTRDDAANAAE